MTTTRRANRWLVAISICALTPGVASATARAVQESDSVPRLLTIDDNFAIERVGSPVLSPDGELVAYTVSKTSLEKNRSRTRIWMVPSAGGESIPMTSESGSASRPRWSPDGRYLSFLASRDEGKTQVWVLDRRGGEAWQLTDTEEGVGSYEWAPDGKRLVLVIQDPEEEDAAEDADPDTAEAQEAAGDGADESSSEPPKPWVVDRLQLKRDYTGYLDHRRDHLYVYELESKALTQITSGDYDDSEPAWAPDGSSIAFVSNRTAEPDGNYNSDIWLVDPGNTDQGADIVAVTEWSGGDSSPRWSPDGNHIAYLTNVNAEIVDYAQTQVAIVAVGANEPRTVLTEGLDRIARDVGFAPDGQSVWFLMEDHGEGQLASVPVGGGEITRVISGHRRVAAADTVGSATVVLAREPHMPGVIYSRQPDGSLLQLTHNNEKLLGSIRLGEVEKVTYPSPDGTPVDAFVVKPPDFDPAVRYPTILWLHGGPQGQYDWGFDFEAQLFAANGYVVLMPNPRGSTGYGQDFTMGIWRAWGIPDTEDAIAAVDHAIELGYTDPDRLGVGGWSYGGILTNYVITSTQRFHAAVSGASGGLWIANYGHDHYQHWYEVEFGLPWEDREIWERLSPFNKVQDITTPTMWVGGEKDWNVPIINSEMMYQSMRRLGRDTLLVVYPDQHHGINLPTYAKDLLERFLDWFGSHLKE